MNTTDALAGLSALAHEGRLDLFRRLVRAGSEGIAAGELARAVGANFTTASAQLAVLSGTRLVTSRRQGRSVIYSADYVAIAELMAFLLEDCCQGRSEVIGPLAELRAETLCAPAATDKR